MTDRNILTAVLLLVAPIALLIGCDPIDTREGQALYAEHCAGCHGANGNGTGPLADGLVPPPADLTRIAARRGGVFDYSAVMSVIDGYKAAERSMPRFGDLLAEAEFIPFDAGDGIQTPTPIPLVELAAYLEEIQVP